MAKKKRPYRSADDKKPVESDAPPKPSESAAPSSDTTAASTAAAGGDLSPELVPIVERLRGEFGAELRTA